MSENECKAGTENYTEVKFIKPSIVSTVLLSRIIIRARKNVFVTIVWKVVNFNMLVLLS